MCWSGGRSAGVEAAKVRARLPPRVSAPAASVTHTQRAYDEVVADVGAAQAVEDFDKLWVYAAVAQLHLRVDEVLVDLVEGEVRGVVGKLGDVATYISNVPGLGVSLRAR